MTRRIAPPALLSALMALWLIVPTATEAAPLQTYIAIGDSLAFGETDFAHNPSYGDRGYVKPFADFLATQDHDRRPEVINLGVDAETSDTFFHGGPKGDGTLSGNPALQLNLNYPESSTTQNSELLSTIAAEKAAGHNISTVSVNLGANDLFVTLHQPDFLNLTPDQQQARIISTLANVQGNYTALLGELKSQVPQASLYLLGYHNPFAADPNGAMEKLAGPAVKALNALISAEAAAFGTLRRYRDAACRP